MTKKHEISKKELKINNASSRHQGKATNKKIPKTELATAIIWKAYYEEKISPSLLARELGVKNIRTMQYQIERLGELGILDFSKMVAKYSHPKRKFHPFERSGHSKSWYVLNPEFKTWFEKNRVERWEKDVERISAKPDIITQSYFVINSIRQNAKTIDDIHKLGNSPLDAEFVLFLFAPFIQRQFEGGHFKYSVKKKLPVLVAENWIFDLENRIVQLAVQEDKQKYKFKLPPDLPLYYPWILYFVTCKDTPNKEGGLSQSVDVSAPKCCRECVEKRPGWDGSIIINMEASSEIRWEEKPVKPKEWKKQCPEKVTALARRTFSFLPEEIGEGRSIMVFWKCPLKKRFTGIRGGTRFIPANIASRWRRYEPLEREILGQG